jgi:hypothetical protein
MDDRSNYSEIALLNADYYKEIALLNADYYNEIALLNADYKICVFQLI